MMDVEEYRKRALDKLAVFWENGIVPPHNLILFKRNRRRLAGRGDDRDDSRYGAKDALSRENK